MRNDCFRCALALLFTLGCTASSADRDTGGGGGDADPGPAATCLALECDRDCLAAGHPGGVCRSEGCVCVGSEDTREGDVVQDSGATDPASPDDGGVPADTGTDAPADLPHDLAFDVPDDPAPEAGADLPADDTSGAADEASTDTPGLDTHTDVPGPGPDLPRDVPTPRDTTEAGNDVPTDTSPACTADEPGSCKNVSLCIYDCPVVGGQYDSTCRAACEAQLDAAGLQAYDAYNTCIQANCSTATTQEEYSACIFSKCVNQYYACYSGCDLATCADLQACIISCPDDNPSTTGVDEFSVCWDACAMSATADAQIDRSDLMTCIRTTCPTCATQATQAEINQCNACYATAISTGGACVAPKDACSKYATCGDVFRCMDTCDSADDACFSTCYSLGSSQAAADYEARGDCVRTNCPTCATQANQQEIDQCNTCFQVVVNGACKTQVDACVSWGTDSCATVLACENGGGSNCLDNISEQGATLWDDMINCAYDACTAQCPNNPTPQQEAACNACINATLNPGGSCNGKLVACTSDT